MRVWAFMVFFAASAAAHSGPPYAIFTDRAVGPYSVDLWGDPDVGTGTFYVLVDAPAAEEGVFARVEVKPVSGRLSWASFDAVREASKKGLRFVAAPAFDAEERWLVKVVVAGPRGAGSAEAEVDVTPPDLGRAGLWFYALPFLGVGLLWAKALLTRRR